MNTQNVKTAAQESSRKLQENLTHSQILDVFCWVLHATDGDPEPMEFTPPLGSWEFTIMHDNCFDYISVWVLNGFPVAAGMPMDHFFRVICAPYNQSIN